MMEIFQAVTTKRSIRRFKPDPVPEALLRESLEAARCFQ
ncbi:MAG: nitroreductase family protein [Deltaproteobacteria bacterium]|nr:nitroreductase family protein [Deltaproteobacteria bacterium]